MNDPVLAVLFGLAIGGALGAFGGGGSVLAVPALVYGLGMSVRQAIPTSLLVVGLTASAAAVAHLRAGNVWIRTALTFGAAGVVGSFAGAWVNHRLPEAVVLGGLAVVMVASAVGMWRRGSTAPALLQIEARGEDRPGERLGRILAVGFGLGLLTGTFGVGGGFLVVPAMALVLALPTRVAIGTSLVVVAINAFAGFVAHAGLAPLDLEVTAAFAVGGLVGAVSGQCVSARLSSGALARGFAVLVGGIGTVVLVDALRGGM